MKSRDELLKAKQILQGFGIKDEKDLAPPVDSDLVFTKGNKTRNIRTLGDPTLIAQSQKIYNPNLPPVKAKGPTEAQTKLGTTTNSGIEGTWGKPGENK